MVDTWRPHQGDQSHPHTPNGQIPLQNTPHLPECPAITDHMPATTSLEIKLKKPKQENPLPRLFNVQCLSEDADVQTQYNLAVMNRFRCLVDLPEDVNSQWSTFCSILTDFAKEAVGYRSHIRQMWCPRTLSKSSNRNRKPNSKMTTLGERGCTEYSRLKLKQTRLNSCHIWQMRLKRISFIIANDHFTRPSLEAIIHHHHLQQSRNQMARHAILQQRF